MIWTALRIYFTNAPGAVGDWAPIDQWVTNPPAHLLPYRKRVEAENALGRKVLIIFDVPCTRMKPEYVLKPGAPVGSTKNSDYELKRDVMPRNIRTGLSSAQWSAISAFITWALAQGNDVEIYGGCFGNLMPANAPYDSRVQMLFPDAIGRDMLYVREIRPYQDLGVKRFGFDATGALTDKTTRGTHSVSQTVYGAAWREFGIRTGFIMIWEQGVQADNPLLHPDPAYLHEPCHWMGPNALQSYRSAIKAGRRHLWQRDPEEQVAFSTVWSEDVPDPLPMDLALLCVDQRALLVAKKLWGQGREAEQAAHDRMVGEFNMALFQ